MSLACGGASLPRRLPAARGLVWPQACREPALVGPLTRPCGRTWFRPGVLPGSKLSCPAFQVHLAQGRPCSSLQFPRAPGGEWTRGQGVRATLRLHSRTHLAACAQDLRRIAQRRQGKCSSPGASRWCASQGSDSAPISSVAWKVSSRQSRMTVAMAWMSIAGISNTVMVMSAPM